MGGMVALELMRLAPERVSHLALVDTNAPCRTPLAAKGLSPPCKSGRRHDAQFQIAWPSAASDRWSIRTRWQDVRAEMVEMSMRVGARAYVRQNHAVIGRGDLRKVLPGVRVPTSVIVGRDDRIDAS